MTFQERLDQCLVSYFTEENYGNLETAWAILEEHKLSVDNDDIEAKANLRESYIWFYQLTGKLDEAYRCLEEYRTLLDQLAPRWKLLYAANKCLLDYYRRHPPVLGFPMDSDVLRVVSPPSRILDTSEILLDVDEWLEGSSEPEWSPERGMCVLFQAIVNSQTGRGRATRHHPLHPSGTAVVDSRSPDEIVAEIVPFLAKIQRMYAQHERDPIGSYVDRRILYIHYAMRSSACDEVSQRLFTRYEAKGDKIGMANCKLLQADAMLSSPFTSPTVLNLIPLILPGATGTSEFRRDEVEAHCPLKPSEEAAQLYEQALELYREASASRGQAAILLRQGCYLYAQALLLGPDQEDCKQLLENASQKLNDSLTLFGMDEANAQVVKANQILLDCSRGLFSTNTITEAADIGHWGRKHQNELLSLTLGSFMMRFARRTWKLYRQFQTALWAYECAERCFQALGDVVSSFAAMFDRAIMHKEVYNGPNALLLAQRCVSMIDMAIQWYDEQLDMHVHASQTEDRQTFLENNRFNLISDFDLNLSSLYARFREQTLLETWKEKHNTLISHPTYQKVYTALGRRNLPEGSVYTRTEVARLERENWQSFTDADIESNKSLMNGDVRGTETPFESFLDSTKDQDIPHSQPAFRIFACQRLGDVNRAREILDSLSDHQIFYQSQSVLPNPNRHLSDQSAHVALYQCVVAQDWKRADHLLNCILEEWPTFWADFGSESSTQLPVYLATIALIDMHNNRVIAAFGRLLDARQHIELGRSLIDDPDVKPGFMKTARIIEVYWTLAEICLLCSRQELPRSILNCYDFGHPAVTWDEHALLFVEEARARATLDALERVKPEDPSDEIVVQRENMYKHRAMIHLESISQPDTAQQKELERLRAEIIPETNLESRPLHAVSPLLHPSELCSHLHKDDLVIEFSFYVTGCIMFAVTSKGIQAVSQGTVRDIDMRRWAMESMQLLKSISDEPAGSDELPKLRSDLSNYCSKIAEVIINPFADIVRQKRHIIFSVTQPLNAFPFSLLPFNNQPLIYHAAVSQTPSLTVLYHLIQRAPTTVSPGISVFAKSILEQKSSSEDTDIADKRPLPWAAIEALQLANMFSTWPIETSSLSREKFRDHIRHSSSILHISTHGLIDKDYPLLSCISLAEKFRVLGLSQIHSTANLVVFSACLSGLGYATAGSDILGFTHVILGTGCQAYLGGLIEINDFTSTVLMMMFYRNIKQRPHHSIAESLRQAQLELMQMDEKKETRLLEEIEDRWDEIRHGEDNADTFVPNGRNFLHWWKNCRLQQIEWASSHIWAPFTLMGYGGLRFGA